MVIKAHASERPLVEEFAGTPRAPTGNFLGAVRRARVSQRRFRQPLHARTIDRAGERRLSGRDRGARGTRVVGGAAVAGEPTVVADRRAHLRHHRLARGALHRRDRQHQPQDQNVREANCISTNAVDFRSHIDEILPVHGVAFNLQPQSLAAALYVGKDRSHQGGGARRTRRGEGRRRSRARRRHLQRSARVLGPQVGARGAGHARRRHRAFEGQAHRDRKSDREGQQATTSTPTWRACGSRSTTRSSRSPTCSAGARSPRPGCACSRTIRTPTSTTRSSTSSSTPSSRSPFIEDAARCTVPRRACSSAGIEAARAVAAAEAVGAVPRLRARLQLHLCATPVAIDNPYNAFMHHPNALGVGLLLVAAPAARLADAAGAPDARRAPTSAWPRRGASRRSAASQSGSPPRTRTRRRRAAARTSRTHSEKVARGWYNAVDQNDAIGVADSRELAEAARNYFEFRMRHLQVDHGRQHGDGHAQAARTGRGLKRRPSMRMTPLLSRRARRWRDRLRRPRRRARWRRSSRRTARSTSCCAQKTGGRLARREEAEGRDQGSWPRTLLDYGELGQARDGRPLGQA